MAVPNGAPHPRAGEWVSNREVYDVMVSLSGDVRALTQAVHELTRNLGDHETRLRALESRPSTTGHETRIAELERRRWPTASVGAVSSVVGVVIAALAVVVTLALA